LRVAWVATVKKLWQMGQTLKRTPFRQGRRHEEPLGVLRFLAQRAAN
jgi:hypothetical protein